MSEAEARPTNFIRQIIDEDLASGKHITVHTRFPPEPNGYLHIGHAKSICLNFGIAQDYKGQCNLRFDDTNPVKEDIEYVDSIKNDVEWLGFHWSGNVRYSSDYFDQLHAYAIELINKGLAYVDELTPEQIREYRGTLTQPGKNSPYRDRSVEENLALFEKMRAGGFEEGKACLHLDRRFCFRQPGRKPSPQSADECNAILWRLKLTQQMLCHPLNNNFMRHPVKAKFLCCNGY